MKASTEQEQRVNDPAKECLAAEHRPLYELMIIVSEALWYARWCWGCEYDIWRAITDPAENDFGIVGIGASTVVELRALSDQLGGWIRWGSHDRGPSFVPTAEWLIVYGAWLERREAQDVPAR